MAIKLNINQADFESRLATLMQARETSHADIGPVVSSIIAEVRKNGDAALRAYTKQFDRFEPGEFRLQQSDIQASANTCKPETRRALELAANRIASYSEKQLPENMLYEDEIGTKLGWRWRAVQSAGLYVPGGLATYPSSVLMNAIPAKVAGVKRLVVTVPAPDGVLKNQTVSLAKASGNLRFAASVAQFGMLLRNSAYMQQASFKSVLSLSKNAMENDAEGYRKEFVALVIKAKKLVNKKFPEKEYEELDEEEEAVSVNHKIKHMQPKVQLSIPEPCHEDWHKMTPSQQGRFCSVCAKEVVDFTSMNDTEVLHYFLDKKNQKVCGRMYPDQLNRPVTKTMYPAKKKRWYWNIAALLLLLSKSAAVKAQGAIKVNTTQQQTGNKLPVQVLGNIMPSKAVVKKIKGMVTDEEGNPVAGAAINVKGSKTGTQSAADGTYTLNADAGTDVLVISAVGFQTTELVLKNKQAHDVVLSELKAQVKGEVVVAVGGIDADYDYYPGMVNNHIAVIEVLDNATHLPVKASITVVKNNTDKNDLVSTDAKGIYKLKRIKDDDRYQLIVKAEGYLEATMDIKGWRFNGRKETAYIFLERQPVTSSYKKMDTVAVTSYGTIKGKVSISCGAESSKHIEQLPAIKNTVSDTLAALRTKLSGSLKIAPNPVQKGSACTVLFTVKKAGSYLFQITNAAGQLLQQQEVAVLQKNNQVQIQTDARWGSGAYYLRLTDTKNNLLSTNSFIVQ